MRPDITADMARQGLPLEASLRILPFSVSKLNYFSSFETEEDRMMAWVGRNT